MQKYNLFAYNMRKTVTYFFTARLVDANHEEIAPRVVKLCFYELADYSVGIGQKSVYIFAAWLNAHVSE